MQHQRVFSSPCRLIQPTVNYSLNHTIVGAIAVNSKYYVGRRVRTRISTPVNLDLKILKIGNCVLRLWK